MANTAAATAATSTLCDECAETCGYLATMIAALAYGSCGVPVSKQPNILRSIPSCRRPGWTSRRRVGNGGNDLDTLVGLFQWSLAGPGWDRRNVC